MTQSPTSKVADLCADLAEGLREVWEEGPGADIANCRYPYYRRLYRDYLLLPIIAMACIPTGIVSALMIVLYEDWRPGATCLVAVLSGLAYALANADKSAKAMRRYSPRPNNERSLRIIRLIRGRPTFVEDYEFRSTGSRPRLHQDIFTPTPSNHEEYLVINRHRDLVHYVGYQQDLYRHLF